MLKRFIRRLWLVPLLGVLPGCGASGLAVPAPAPAAPLRQPVQATPPAQTVAQSVHAAASDHPAQSMTGHPTMYFVESGT